MYMYTCMYMYTLCTIGLVEYNPPHENSVLGIKVHTYIVHDIVNVYTCTCRCRFCIFFSLLVYVSPSSPPPPPPLKVFDGHLFSCSSDKTVKVYDTEVHCRCIYIHMYVCTCMYMYDVHMKHLLYMYYEKCQFARSQCCAVSPSLPELSGS